MFSQCSLSAESQYSQKMRITEEYSHTETEKFTPQHQGDSQELLKGSALGIGEELLMGNLKKKELYFNGAMLMFHFQPCFLNYLKTRGTFFLYAHLKLGQIISLFSRLTRKKIDF